MALQAQEASGLSDLLLVDPVVAGLAVADEFVLAKPQSNLLLGVLNRVRTVADVAADILLPVSGQGDDGLRMRGLTMAKSPRMVPGAEARGLVAPRRMRPVLTASRPSQTIAQMGPEFMYSTNPGKKGLLARSASGKVSVWIIAIADI
jgi:hypothetical protein